jgi:hypothetical protein
MRLRLLFMTLLCCTLAESVSLADTNVDCMNLLRAGKLEYRSGHFAAAEPLFLDALGDMHEAAGRKMEANVPFSRAAAIGVRHLDKPDMF